MRVVRMLVYGFVVISLMIPAVALAATEIVYWDFIKPGDGTPRGNMLTKHLERFHAKYPDIRVKVEVIPPPMIDPNLIQGAAAGSTPDVVRVNISLLSTHVSAGAIQPLDKFAEKMDKNDWLVPWSGTVYDGKKYALPYEHRMSALLYRKDILAKAGVQVPTTWDEVCAAAGKINSPQVMGYAYGLSQADSTNALMEWVENMIPAAGGKLFDEKGRAAFNDAAGLKFFQTIADLAGKCKATGPAAAEFTYNSINEGLAAGTIAMAALGTHRFAAIRAAGAKENLEWAPPPTYEKGKKAQVKVMGWNFVMGKHSKNPEAAWKFMEFMTSPETGPFIAQAGELPVRKSTYKDPWFKTEEAKAMVGWSEYLAQHGEVFRYPASWGQFGQFMAEGTQSIVLKGTAPKQALATVVERYNKYVAENK